MRNVLIGLVLSIGLICNAQTSFREIEENPQKAGSVYFAYPGPTGPQTAAPKGYEPFYISHYGRHGSRYLIVENDYKWVLDIFRNAEKADALTPLGKQVLLRLDSVWKEAEGRGGELTPLGVRQHQEIASRMAEQYPEIFLKTGINISARSTSVPRCILSMDAFCESLKAINPKLNITRESSKRFENYLSYYSPEFKEYASNNGPWFEEYRKFKSNLTHPGRLISSLFSKPTWVHKNVNATDLMWGLYWIAIGMQNIQTPVSFLEVFTTQELFDLWQSVNYRFYVRDSNYPENHQLPLLNARNLLKNIIESADKALLSSTPSATLRFGHDRNLIPFAAILGLEGCAASVTDPMITYQHFADFKIAPMAGNIQLVFARNKHNSQDVLVKILLNENETMIPEMPTPASAPWYKWEDLRKYYQTKWNL